METLMDQLKLSCLQALENPSGKGVYLIPYTETNYQDLQNYLGGIHTFKVAGKSFSVFSMLVNQQEGTIEGVVAMV